MIKFYVIILVFIFVLYKCIDPTITLRGYECVGLPNDPSKCENVTSLLYIGDFSLGEVIVIGKLELGNGTVIDIKFEVLNVALGFLQSSAGIMRNGFVKSEGVAMCPNVFVPSASWCGSKCEDRGTCTPCLGCPQTPRQSLGGEDFCILCDDPGSETGPVIECDCSEVIPIPEGCSCSTFGIPPQLSEKFAACISVVKDEISPSGQSVSRLDILRPENFIGTGVLHVTSQIHDFFILLSDTNQQVFPSIFITTVFNTTVLVSQTGELGISPFNPTQIIADDLSKQGPSPIDKYLIFNDEFYYTLPDDSSRFGPIQEFTGEPNKFFTHTKPLSVLAPFPESYTLLFQGCKPFFDAVAINLDIKVLLFKESSLQLTESTYQDEALCKSNAAARCNQFNLSLFEEPSCDEGKAFFRECAEGNVEPNQPSTLRIDFGLPGINIIGEEPLNCDVISVNVKNCVTDEDSGNGDCLVDINAVGTGSITFFRILGNGGFRQKTFDCEQVTNGKLEIVGIDDLTFIGCFDTISRLNGEIPNSPVCDTKTVVLNTVVINIDGKTC